MILIWTSNGNTRPNGLFWGSTNPRQFILTEQNEATDLSTWCSPYSSSGIHQSLTRARPPGPGMKRCTHGGYPLESPLVFRHPHVMALHQSDPLVESLNHVARPVWVHSSLFSCAGQDGEFAPVDCLIFRTDRDSI